MTAEVVSSRAGLRQTLAGAAPGLVPTMGALHDGHLALIARSARENPQTVVSIFVNPTQFGDPADLKRYPRHLGRDIAAATRAGATLIFAPDVSAIYPPGFDTWVEPGDLGRRWEGEARPGHFRGVATVVTILLNLVRPARAYFGEKDYQQLQIIRRLHRDLALPGDIIGCETIRDPDGLALSSRNARLAPEHRRLARRLPEALTAVSDLARQGERSAARLEAAGRSALDHPDIYIDYLAIVDEETLSRLTTLEHRARLLVAVEIGGVRLIDNQAVTPPEHSRS